MASKLDYELVGNSVDKILALAAGKTVDGKVGVKRNFVQTVDLQVRFPTPT